VKMFEKIKTRFFKNFLFNGDDALFKKYLISSKKYGEYGCGKSTIWVAENTAAAIYSVDTSEEWINSCKAKLHGRKVNFKWIECGSLKGWGRPKNYEKRANFISYAESFWEDGFSPDTILIDGRFRVLCFLTSLKYASEGTIIIFDDYTNRPHYHIVEEFIPQTEVYGRQCVFIVPSKNSIDMKLINQYISKFEYVMD
jgi:hypothetical protein